MEKEELREELLKQVGGLGTEVGAGLALDKATAPLLAAGPLGWAGYGAINFGGGVASNYAAQRIRGEEDINYGELISSGLLGIIPFTSLRFGKRATQIAGEAGTVKRAIVGGAGMGASDRFIQSGLNERKLPSPTDVAVGTVAGGALGGTFQKSFDEFGKILDNYKAKGIPTEQIPQAISKDPKASRHLSLLRNDILDAYAKGDSQLVAKKVFEFRKAHGAEELKNYDSYEQYAQRKIDLQGKLNDNIDYNEVQDELELASSRWKTGQDIYTDEMSEAAYNDQLDEFVSFELGYNTSNVDRTTPYRSRTKSADGNIIPKEIATPFVRHGEAYLRSGADDLTDFPKIWWDGEPWVLRQEKVYKTVNGKRTLVKTRVGIERWAYRKTRQKEVAKQRKRRLSEQSEGVKRGTAAYEKVKQLRELNAREKAAGVTRTRLRDTDLDHIAALRSVDYYTAGMPPDLRKQFYQKIGALGIFTGDRASNLKLRQRVVHKKLWPLLKARLKDLGHRHTGFKNQQERFDYYNSINPETDVTRIEEYVEAVQFVEEVGDDLMEELLTVAKQKKVVKGSKKISPSDPVKEALIEIFGSEEDYKTFMDRIREIPEKIDGKPVNLREQFILGEIEYKN
tara:strand:+ start:63 stop:1934 length:1872 start_codon:yes stop_codon:yes gene_type:complete